MNIHIKANDKLEPELQEYFDHKVKELKKPQDITFIADDKPYLTELDYDNWFKWVGIIPKGQILIRSNGVCMSKQTFEDITNVVVDAEYDKKYKAVLYIEETQE